MQPEMQPELQPEPEPFDRVDRKIQQFVSDRWAKFRPLDKIQAIGTKDESKGEGKSSRLTGKMVRDERCIPPQSKAAKSLHLLPEFSCDIS
jgi:hypothetical protein